MTPSNIEPSAMSFDLSQYTSEELVGLWKSGDMTSNPGLLAASLDDEITFCAILEIMVTDSRDIFSRDNVNWTVTDAIEEILVDIIPMVDDSQSGGAMLLLGWIQWVNGRLKMAIEAFPLIKETNFQSPLVDYMFGEMFPDALLALDAIRSENG